MTISTVKKLQHLDSIRLEQIRQLTDGLRDCSFELKLLHAAHPGPITRGRRREIGKSLARAAELLGMLS